jgi:hypothetical protein
VPRDLLGVFQPDLGAEMRLINNLEQSRDSIGSGIALVGVISLLRGNKFKKNNHRYTIIT